MILNQKLGDVVKAHEVYLQEHLSNSSYRSATECRLAEDLIMAFVHLDIDALDKAKNSMDVRHLDREMQVVVKSLSLFAAKTAPSSSSFPASSEKKVMDIRADEDDKKEEEEEQEVEGRGEVVGERVQQQVAGNIDDEEDEIDLC